MSATLVRRLAVVVLASLAGIAAGAILHPIVHGVAPGPAAKDGEANPPPKDGCSCKAGCGGKCAGQSPCACNAVGNSACFINSGFASGMWAKSGKEFDTGPFATIHAQRGWQAGVIALDRGLKEYAGKGFDFSIAADKSTITFQIRDEKGKLHFVPVTALLKLVTPETKPPESRGLNDKYGMAPEQLPPGSPYPHQVSFDAATPTPSPPDTRPGP